MQLKLFSKQSVGKALLPVFVKKVLTRFLGVLAPSGAKAFSGETAITAKTLAGDYEAWCDRFLLERLRLGLLIAILFNFTLLVAIQFTAVEPAIKKLVPSIPSLIAAIEISLLGCLALHKNRKARRYPGLLFLCFSWSGTLVEQIWATLHHVALPNLGGWCMVFLTQATLMPVRWRLHLISQLGVIAYCLGVNPLLGLTLPDGKPLLTLEYSSKLLYLFWFCLICDLAIYMYERLQSLS